MCVLDGCELLLAGDSEHTEAAELAHGQEVVDKQLELVSIWARAYRDLSTCLWVQVRVLLESLMIQSIQGGRGIRKL